MNWLPIETAPKDGTPILCFWDQPYIESYQRMDVAMFSGGEWHEPDDPEDQFIDPAYWMPLPKPPKDVK